MGNGLPYGLGDSVHWIDMVGGGRGEGQSQGRCLSADGSTAFAILKQRVCNPLNEILVPEAKS